MNTYANGESIQDYAAMRRNMGASKEEAIADAVEKFTDSAVLIPEIKAAAEDGFDRED